MKAKFKFDGNFFLILFVAVVFDFLAYCLFDNPLLSLISFLLGGTLLFFSYRQKEKQRKMFEEETSAYSFFDCFLKHIENSAGVKSAYESANRYLLGYQENVPYEELISNSSLLHLFREQNNFSLIMQKESQNEAHLLFYRPLIEENESELLSRQDRQRKLILSEKICLMLAPAILFLTLACFTFWDISLPDSPVFFVSAFIAFTLTLPAIFFFEAYEYKGMNYDKAN